MRKRLRKKYGIPDSVFRITGVDVLTGQVSTAPIRNRAKRVRDVWRKRVLGWIESPSGKVLEAHHPLLSVGDGIDLYRLPA